jgi:hypothetical protein
MKNLLHPLAVHTPKTLDVLFGGNERETMDESMKLAFEAVKYLPKEQNVLYVNTLIDQESLERKMHRYASRRPRLLYVTWLEKSFMERLETLEYYFKNKEIGTLLINSFDCAALTQRHRVELGQWLRRVRNLYKLRIIICMQCKPGYYGVNGSLRFAATNLMEIGSYLKEHECEYGSTKRMNEEVIAQAFEKENKIELEEETASVAAEAPKVETLFELITEGGSIAPSPEIAEADESAQSDEQEEEEVIDEAVQYQRISYDDEIDDDEPWVAQSTNEELETMLGWNGGDLTDALSGWVIEEIEKRQRMGVFPKDAMQRIEGKYGVDLRASAMISEESLSMTSVDL